jgi:hypothetical protein
MRPPFTRRDGENVTLCDRLAQPRHTWPERGVNLALSGLIPSHICPLLEEPHQRRLPPPVPWNRKQP